MDLSGFSLKELQDLQNKVAKAITDFSENKKRDALEELDRKARELGFSLAELTGTAPLRKRSASTAKFANPANPEDTWSGRGRKPRWYIEALEAGKAPEDLAV